MQIYLNIALIVIAIVMILAILLQAKGGGLGSIFGGSDSVFRTKRGIEKTVFQITIILAILFVVISLIALKVG